jgi:glycosyltransferase involved in cell wall biosynthesis
VAQALATLSNPAAPAGVVDLVTDGPQRPVPLDLLLKPEWVGGVLLQAEFLRACASTPLETGSLARATAVLRAACGFEVVRVSAALVSPAAPAQPSYEELSVFGLQALQTFAAEDLYPRLRTPEGEGQHPEVLMECSRNFRDAGRLTEVLRLSATAQTLLEGRDTGVTLPLAMPRPAPWPCTAPDSSPSQTADPLVTLIVPTFDRPVLLARALESMAQQTVQDFEVIVVDDGGEDPSTVVSSFRKRLGDDRRVTLIRHDRNRGLPSARNTGLRRARGRYVGFLDDDDCLLPHHLAALLSHLRLGNRIVYGDVRIVAETPGEPLPVTARISTPYQSDYDPEAHRLDNCFPVHSFLCERSLLSEAGGFDEALPALEDWDLWLRVFEIVPPVRVPRVTAEVRQRTDASSMTDAARSIWLEVLSRIYGKTLRFERENPNLRRLRAGYLMYLGEKRGVAFPRDAEVWLRGGRNAPVHRSGRPALRVARQRCIVAKRGTSERPEPAPALLDRHTGLEPARPMAPRSFYVHTSRRSA